MRDATLVGDALSRRVEIPELGRPTSHPGEAPIASQDPASRLVPYRLRLWHRCGLRRLSQAFSEALTSVMQRASHGSRRHTKHVGDIGFPQSTHVPERDRGAFPRSERSHGIPDLDPKFWRWSRRLGRRAPSQQSSFHGLAAHAAPQHVQGSRIGPSAGRLHTPDTRPTLQRPCERLIRHLARDIHIPRRQDHRAQEPTMLISIPLLETALLPQGPPISTSARPGEGHAPRTTSNKSPQIETLG